MSRPVLSVVVPVYNEEVRIRKTLSKLTGYLDRRFPQSEILVVNDGSTDKTSEILEEIEDKLLRVLSNKKNHGKGYAVRQGVLAAKGNIIFFTDADMSTPAQEIGRFMKLMEKEKVDILIGSRSVKGTKLKIRQPCYRQNMGKIFNWFVKRLTGLPFEDTQCGFKAFRRAAAEALFKQAKQNGFVFDVELLLLAQRQKMQVREVPVTWVNSPKSRVSPITDSVRMFGQLLEINRQFGKL